LRNLVGSAWCVAAVVSVALMTAGTVSDSPRLRAWALLVAIAGATLWLWAERREAQRQHLRAEERYLEYVKRWAHQPYELGWSQCEAAMQVKATRR
jgi:hypothetical protein